VPEPRDPRLSLRGCLATLAVTQDAWLTDLAATVADEGDPLDAFIRWNESLSQIRLALARADRRLADLPVITGTVAAPGPGPRPADGHRLRTLLEAWMDRNGIATTWRRVDDPADLDHEAEHADITTDFATLITAANHTGPGLERLMGLETSDGWEGQAYYAVISPWRHAARPLDDCLAWLRGQLAERPDW
jgi:hypothetical protein